MLILEGAAGQEVCQGLATEMGTIANVCCGTALEFCSGGDPIPSECDADSCAPVFNGFYSRCKDVVRNDPNARLYTEFIAMCRNHPATGESSLLPDSGLAVGRGLVAIALGTSLAALSSSYADIVVDHHALMGLVACNHAGD